VSDSPDSLGGSEAIHPRAEDRAADPATVPDPLPEHPTEGYTDVAEPTLLAAGVPPTDPWSFEPPVPSAAADPVAIGPGPEAVPVDGRPAPRPFFAPPPSAPAAEPVEVAPALADISSTSGARRTRRGRPALVAALVGGVVGALVASGMYTVLDDDDASIVQAPPASNVIVRPSDRIESSGDIAAILKADVPAVVAIVDDDGPRHGGAAGTGFVVSSDGVIVTNNHVIEGADTIQAHFSDGKELTAKVLGTAPSSDLAVIQVEGSNLPTIELGDSDQVQVGDDVVAIGNALALEGGLSVTRGIVSGLHRDLPTGDRGFLGDVIQTDAAINPGNSGGPLVDSKGRVIGINTAIADPSNAQNVGFAIPISQVKSLISELREGRNPSVLGVTADFESDEDGALIASVSEGSPADKGGIEAGDVVVQVGNIPVHSSGGLRPAIRRYKAGQEVEVVVTRDGKRTTLRVTLGEATEADS
jgi:putative serine protease PepD